MRLVSVIIPAFNAAQWLPDALASVQAQTYPHVETIVVDDGSRDATLPVARRFENARTRIIHTENAGAASARNTALAVAQGEYIQYLDADDLLSPDKVAAAIALLEGDETRLAVARWAKFSGNGPLSTAVLENQPLVSRDLMPLDYLEHYVAGRGMYLPGAWLVPRAIADRAGPWRAGLGFYDDGEYFARVVLASAEIRFEPHGVHYYRAHVGGLSTDRSLVNVERCFRATQHMSEAILAHEDSPRTRHMVACHFQAFVYVWYPYRPDLLRRAQAIVEECGGAHDPYIRPQRGSSHKARFATRLLGWKLVRRLQQRRVHRQPVAGTS